MRRTIVRWAQKIIKIPFFKRTFSVVSFSAATMDIQESFLTCMNSTLPAHHRAVAAVRGSCCSGALITSYFATKTPTPQVKLAFQVCCHTFGAVYLLSGGNAAVSLTLSHNATSIN